MMNRRSFVVAAAGQALAKPFQPWRKQGLILPPGFAGTRSKDSLSAPSLVRLKNGGLRLYFWARQSGFSYIYAVESAPGAPGTWTLVTPDPMLGPSPIGNLNDKGPGFPFVLRRDDAPWLLYYCSWGSWAPRDEISNRTCLAISYDEGITWTVLREPLLPLGPPGSFDGGLTGSVCVTRSATNRYRMWYTAGGRYAMIGPIKRAIAHIGYATSKDGVNWEKDARPIMSPREDAVQPYEAVVSKPTVLFLHGAYHMWLSVFCMEGRGYRLNYAHSTDGIRWQRFYDEILPLTPGGFDSDNQSYANVVEQGNELWMFYVGNDFGRTGIGLATLGKSFLEG
jgi:hypothetical protein